MDSHEVAQQMQVEHGLLQHLIQGLRATAAWPVPGPDASRKLSTLRFVAGSFQRHLERLLALEEFAGVIIAWGIPYLACRESSRASEGMQGGGERRSGGRKIGERVSRISTCLSRPKRLRATRHSRRDAYRTWGHPSQQS